MSSSNRNPNYDVTRPHALAAPVVYDSPHSGADFPADFGNALEERLLRGYADALVDELYAHVPSQGSPLLRALFPRTYIDVNRALSDLDPAMIDGNWPYPIGPPEKSRAGVGLIWKRVRDHGHIYDRLLGVDEVMNRIDRYWRPYHEELARLIDEAHGQFGTVYHVNCHSMTACGAETTPDGPTERPDFVLGDRNGQCCDAAFTLFVQECLAAMGYSVAVNAPYPGVELVRRYSEPASGRHSLQIEINRKLYLDEKTLEPGPGFDGLKSDLEKLTAAIGGFALEAATCLESA